MTPQDTTVYWLYTESPLHIGTGLALGSVDQPVVRERTLNLPYIPSTSLKGVLRDRFNIWAESADTPLHRHAVNQVFGPTLENADDRAPKSGGHLYPGAATFSDARLMIMPIPSADRMFVWVTCPTILARAARDLGLAGDGVLADACRNALSAVASSEVNAAWSNPTGSVYLDDGKLDCTQSADIKHLAKYLRDRLYPGDTSNYFATKLLEDLIVVSDGLMRQLADSGLEVRTRIRMALTKPSDGDADQTRRSTKVVDSGGLWTEENVPPEAVFYSVIFSEAGSQREADSGAMSPLKSSQVAKLIGGSHSSGTLGPATDWSHIQLGGNATVGRGVVRIARWSAP